MATRKPAAETAEPIDAEPVEETKPASNLEFFQGLVAQMRKQLKAELGSEVGSLKTQLDNLEALVTSGVGLTEEEDALNDRVASAVVAKYAALHEDLKANEGQVDSLSSVVQQLQNDTNKALAHLGAETSGVGGAVEELSTALGAANRRIAQLENERGDEIVRVQGQPYQESGAPAILDALWKVMQDVTYVPKSGTYEGGSSGNYKFRRFDDVAKELGEAFRRHGVFLRPEVTSGEHERFETVKEYRNGGKSVQVWTERRLVVAYTFVSLADGSEQTIQVEGEGRDLSDKATAKAMTMALKTALTQAFMLPSDAPDPDSERPGDGPDEHVNPADTDYAPDYDQARREEYHAREDTRPAPSGEPEEHPAVRAAKALEWAGKATNLAELSQVINRAIKTGIAQHRFPDGETLQAKILAIRHTLPGQQ